MRQRRRQLDRSLEDGTAPWLAKIWSRTAVAGTGMAFAWAWVTGTAVPTLFDTSRPAFWLTLASGPLLATVATGVAWWGARKERRRSLDDTVRRAEEELARYRGPGWVRRTLRTGALMGLGVGLPVGLLIAFTFPAAEQPAGVPALGVLQFIAMTMCWTLPMAFLIRWLFLRQMTGRTPPEAFD